MYVCLLICFDYLLDSKNLQHLFNQFSFKLMGSKHVLVNAEIIFENASLNNEKIFLINEIFKIKYSKEYTIGNG